MARGRKKRDKKRDTRARRRRSCCLARAGVL
jgi:hypothetical protein